MKYQNITISGRICTGKSTLFHALKDSLHWMTFSTSQFFRDYAKKNHHSLEKAEEQNDRITKEIDYKVQDMLSDQKFIIVEGWMAGALAKNNKHVLKVLLTCDNDMRIKRFALREHVTMMVAKQRIHDRESSLLATLQKIYHLKNIFDTSYYDVVIDTTGKNEEEIRDIVLTSLDPHLM
ncbi:hypothetical protein COY90_02770 [Candidatus Roizmanbacteria bacterium CG_4_10_14_0_8_um_filter_39_9]|uniref:(d)CMP kinase n=1 Tax=Candidatus Roizmanbacteria bacterium CG_4_10_14_0_8_um_filter_39_9 TaxID=1974829 RepID=A0A2M7QCW6_9BACT|nr:MAG: hypothetical protein COY90_02770 [Candidatus Roizmanbacteria bacterium CG_4_10_14_0_8_um_filter_39_9]